MKQMDNWHALSAQTSHISDHCDFHTARRHRTSLVVLDQQKNLTGSEKCWEMQKQNEKVKQTKQAIGSSLNDLVTDSICGERERERERQRQRQRQREGPHRFQEVIKLAGELEDVWRDQASVLSVLSVPVLYYRRWTMKSNPCCIVVNPRTRKFQCCLWAALGTGGQKKSNPEHRGS